MVTQLLRSFGKHNTAFGTKDKEKVNLLLTKAELEFELQRESNAELLMQCMIYRLDFDPMTNGQKLSEQLWDYMVKQQHWLQTIRVVFGKAV
jgi:hypothetical protein